MRIACPSPTGRNVERLFIDSNTGRLLPPSMALDQAGEPDLMELYGQLENFLKHKLSGEDLAQLSNIFDNFLPTRPEDAEDENEANGTEAFKTFLKEKGMAAKDITRACDMALASRGAGGARALADNGGGRDRRQPAMDSRAAIARFDAKYPNAARIPSQG